MNSSNISKIIKYSAITRAVPKKTETKFTLNAMEPKRRKVKSFTINVIALAPYTLNYGSQNVKVIVKEEDVKKGNRIFVEFYRRYG